MNKDKFIHSALAGVTAMSSLAASVAPVFASENNVSFETKEDNQKVLSRKEMLEKKIWDSQNQRMDAQKKADSIKEAATVANNNVERMQNQYDEAWLDQNAAITQINSEMDAKFQPIMDEIAKLENEIEETNKKIEIQKAASQKTSMEWVNAQKDLETKQKELDDLKKRLEELGVKDYKELETKLNKTLKAFDEATASADAAKVALNGTKEELDTAITSVASATANVQQATLDYNVSLDLVHTLEKEVSAAKNNVANFTDEDALLQNQEKLKQAESDLEMAKIDVETKASNLEKAKDDLENAEKQQAEKQSIYDLSVKTFTDANMQVEKAESAKKEAQKALDEAVENTDAKAKEVKQLNEQIVKVQHEVEDAQLAYDKAKTAYDSSLTPLEKAKKDLAAFETKYADQLAQLSQGIKGYYDSIGANAAIDILEDPRGKLNGHTNIGAANDATSLENVLNSITYLKEFNKIRNKEGLSELKVSMVLMAISQVNANWQRDTAEIGSVEHSGVYKTGENAAWGYGDADTKASPFTVWYNLEKSWYQNGITDFHKVGHYKNIVSKAYDYTGYAHIEEGCYGSTDIQEFDQYWGENAYGVEATASDKDRVLTLDAFEKSLHEYVSNLQEVAKQHGILEEAVKNAQEDPSSKDDTVLKQALEWLNLKKETLKALNNQLTSISKEQANAEKEKEEALKRVEKANEDVKNANAQVNVAAKDKNEAEMALDASKKEVAEKNTAKVDAENALKESKKNVSDISDSIRQLKHRILNWNEEKEKANQVLVEAENRLSEARLDFKTKTKNLEKAKSALSNAELTKEDVQKRMNQALMDSQQADMDLKKAQTEYGLIKEKADSFRDTSTKVGVLQEAIVNCNEKIEDLHHQKEKVDSQLDTLTLKVDTLKENKKQYQVQLSPLQYQRIVLANVIEQGTQADLSLVRDAKFVGRLQHLAQKVDALKKAKKALEDAKLDYQIQNSAYLKAHEDLNTAVDAYNRALDELNVYLNSVVNEQSKKADRVNTGVDTSTLGYMSAAGLAVVGMVSMKRKRKNM